MYFSPVYNDLNTADGPQSQQKRDNLPPFREPTAGKSVLQIFAAAETGCFCNAKMQVQPWSSIMSWRQLSQQQAVTRVSQLWAARALQLMSVFCSLFFPDFTSVLPPCVKLAGVVGICLSRNCALFGTTRLQSVSFPLFSRRTLLAQLYHSSSLYSPQSSLSSFSVHQILSKSFTNAREGSQFP